MPVAKTPPDTPADKLAATLRVFKNRVDNLSDATGEPHYLYSRDHIDYIMDHSPDFASTPEIRAKLYAEFDRDTRELSNKRDEHGATAADDRVEQLCVSCQDLSWALANTMPTSIAGVAAVLRYANDFEDLGEEWPDTDAIGSDGWHYQIRQTAARALETLLS